MKSDTKSLPVKQPDDFFATQGGKLPFEPFPNDITWEKFVGGGFNLWIHVAQKMDLSPASWLSALRGN